MMELSFEENIASRGWHYYGKDVWKWKNQKTGETQREKNHVALKIDPYLFAWDAKKERQTRTDCCWACPT